MNEFEAAQEKAFEELSAYETIRILKKEDAPISVPEFNALWEVKKEIEGLKDPILLYVAFGDAFPLEIPKIYLDKDSYDRIKYIPHTDSDYMICTYDTEKTRTNPDDPAGVVYDCLRRARIIIEQGLKKVNFEDFKTEFISYWECVYSKKDKINRNILSLIVKSPIEAEVKLLTLQQKIGHYEQILYQECDENNRFKIFLNDFGLKFSEKEVFYSDKIIINDYPPFELTNRHGVELIQKFESKRIKEFEKKSIQTGGLLVLMSKTIGNKIHYLGWIHSEPILQHDGFRSGSITPVQTLARMQGQKIITRILPTEYSNRRVSERTSGVDNQTAFKFLVAGIGSVGSNLIYFLNSLSSPEFHFIDSDILTIDNMGRHLLGMSYIDQEKTLAIKEHLRLINPKQLILTKELHLTDVFRTDPNFINECDYLFIAIGKYNIENWVVTKIKSGEINKPTFILWVEPYLAGGHCLFVYPDDFKYAEFYEMVAGSPFFKYNVIAQEDYQTKTDILSLKEGGCQTAYTPYSGNNMLLFLSALFPKIQKIITGKNKKTVSMSWIGDKEMIESLGIGLSKFGLNHDSFTLIENT